LARRRGGKTSTLCAFTAVLLAILPGQNVLFFSTGERISMLGRDKITEFLDVLIHSEATRKFANVKYKTGKETLRVRSIFGTWNRANFYPAKVEVCIISFQFMRCIVIHVVSYRNTMANTFSPLFF